MTAEKQSSKESSPDLPPPVLGDADFHFPGKDGPIYDRLLRYRPPEFEPEPPWWLKILALTALVAILAVIAFATTLPALIRIPIFILATLVFLWWLIRHSNHPGTAP